MHDYIIFKNAQMQESLVVELYACVLLEFNSLNYNYVSKVHLWVRSRQCKGI